MLRMRSLTKRESLQAPNQGLVNDEAGIGKRNYRQNLRDSVQDKIWRRLDTVQTGITRCTKSEMRRQRL